MLAERHASPYGVDATGYGAIGLGQLSAGGDFAPTGYLAVSGGDISVTTGESGSPGAGIWWDTAEHPTDGTGLCPRGS